MNAWPSLSPAGADCAMLGLSHLPDIVVFVCAGVATTAKANNAHAHRILYFIFSPPVDVCFESGTVLPRLVRTLLRAAVRVYRKAQRRPVGKKARADSNNSHLILG